jgi:hypothetical protein
MVMYRHHHHHQLQPNGPPTIPHRVITWPPPPTTGQQPATTSNYSPTATPACHHITPPLPTTTARNCAMSTSPRYHHDGHGDGGPHSRGFFIFYFIYYLTRGGLYPRDWHISVTWRLNCSREAFIPTLYSLELVIMCSSGKTKSVNFA